MLTFVFLAVAIPVPEEPASVALFADAAWYKDQPAKEETFVGVLTRFTRTGPIGPRFNAYRLILDGTAPDLREVHVADKGDAVAPFVGKKVKLVGKAVETDADGRRLREVWPARLVVLDDGPPAGPRRVNVLGEHKLYAREPGAEKVLDGVLRKEEKGGYVLELEKTKEELTLYPDAGDALGPFVGKRVRLGGKQVEGLVGMRTFRHTLPGWIELVDATPPSLDRRAVQRQVDLLRRYQQAEETRRADLQKLNPAPGGDSETARSFARRDAEAAHRLREVGDNLAELERQLAQPGLGATRADLERALAQERKRRDDALARFKEIQRILANINDVAPAEFIQARRDEAKVKAEVEQAAERVRELEDRLRR